MKERHQFVCIILVNWNGWQDTQRCLESLFAADCQDFRVVVCDNASSDGSLEKLQYWARNNGISCEFAGSEILSNADLPPPQSRLLLTPTGSNLGFAGACNIGLQHVLGHAAYSHAWLLNNDTVVSRTTLREMLEANRKDHLDRPVGSKIYHLDRPDVLQVYGGQRLGRGPLISPHHCRQNERIDFLVGSSIFVSRERLQTLGTMYEDFFLNAEDLLYTLNYQREFSREHPGEVAFVITGRIWHKEASSQGRNQFLHSYYYSRNVLLVARKLGAVSFMATGAHTVLRLVKALCLLRLDRARGIMLGSFHALLGRLGRLDSGEVLEQR